MKNILFFVFVCIALLYGRANVTVVSGADPIKFYLGNYPYTDMIGLTNMPALTLRLATDLDALCFKNSDGDLFKLLRDASDSIAAADGRVFFADSTGAATTATAFSYSSGFVEVPSLNIDTCFWLWNFDDDSLLLWSKRSANSTLILHAGESYHHALDGVEISTNWMKLRPNMNFNLGDSMFIYNDGTIFFPADYLNYFIKFENDTTGLFYSTNTNTIQFRQNGFQRGYYDLDNGLFTTDGTLIIAGLFTIDTMVPPSTTPQNIAVWDADSGVLKRYPMDSIAKVYHGVGIDTFPVAATNKTFTGSNIFRRGDTMTVGVLSSEEIEYSQQIAAAATSPYYICENSSGDIFAAASNNVIYKQTGGSGAFSSQGSPSQDDYTALWCDIYDTLWVCTDSTGSSSRNGAVYKSGDDGVTWDSISWPDHNYSGGTCDTLGNIYLFSWGASVANRGKIWVKYAGVDTLDTLSESALNYRGACCNTKTNDIYVAVENFGIKKRVGGIGTFQTESIGYGTPSSIDWFGCSVDTFGNVYACTYGSYQYKQQNGIGIFNIIPNSLLRMYGTTGKRNGDVAFVGDTVPQAAYNELWILSAEDSKIAFHVESGKFQTDGANILTHTIVDDNPDLLAGKNTVDNQIIYARPESLTVGHSTSFGVIDTSYVLLDTLFYIVGSDTFYTATKK